jgi:hypothetical protein
MEVAFIVVYAAILGLVTPYILGRREEYGVLVPAAASLIAGSALWAILTWVGFKYTEAWIWIIVMLAMPAALVISARILLSRRKASDAAALLRLKNKQAGAKPAAQNSVEYLS